MFRRDWEVIDMTMIYVGSLHLGESDDEDCNESLLTSTGTSIFYDVRSKEIKTSYSYDMTYTIADKVDEVKSRYFLSARKVGSSGDLRLKVGSGVARGKVYGLPKVQRNFNFILYARWYNKFYHSNEKGNLTFELKFSDKLDECISGFDSIPLYDKSNVEIDNCVSMLVEGHYVWSCFVYPDLAGYALKNLNIAATYQGYVYEVSSFDSKFKWTAK